jgi:nitrate reductase gamma subunit
MSNLFFGYGPYVALLVCAVGLGLRLPAAWPRMMEAWRGPWQSGALAVAVGAGIVSLNHLLGLLFRESMRAFYASPPRLFAFEAVSLIGGMLLAWGLIQLATRFVRPGEASRGLQGFYLLLLFQVAQGVALAVGKRWGALWSLDLTVPYLRSLLTLSPDVALLEQAPLMVRLHVLAGFMVVAVAPFVLPRRALEPREIRSSSEAPLLPSPQKEAALKAEP